MRLFLIVSCSACISSIGCFPICDLCFDPGPSRPLPNLLSSSCIGLVYVVFITAEGRDLCSLPELSPRLTQWLLVLMILQEGSCPLPFKKKSYVSILQPPSLSLSPPTQPPVWAPHLPRELIECTGLPLHRFSWPNDGQLCWTLLSVEASQHIEGQLMAVSHTILFGQLIFPRTSLAFT